MYTIKTLNFDPLSLCTLRLHKALPCICMHFQYWMLPVIDHTKSKGLKTPKFLESFYFFLITLDILYDALIGFRVWNENQKHRREYAMNAVNGLPQF